VPGLLRQILDALEALTERASAHIKLVDQALTGMEGSYVELLVLVALVVLAAIPLIVPERRRQLYRRLTQLAGIVIFIFVVYTCMGVFGMIRNAFRGLSEIGRENVIALYLCSVPATVLATSMIFGPMFCGWLCPTGALQEFAGLLVRRWHARRRAANWGFSWGAFALSCAMLGLFVFWVIRLAATRVFFVEDAGIYWSEVLILLLFALLWRRRQWDRRLRRLRVVSLAVIVFASVAGWNVTSPVHFSFAKVYDPASVLSTAMVVLGALLVPQVWCRYLCPWREAIGWAARHSARKLETATERCTRCGRCDEVCGVDAVHRGVVDPRECHMCLRCVDTCPTKAIRLTETWKAQE
jgi:polyferredoxin